MPKIEVVGTVEASEDGSRLIVTYRGKAYRTDVHTESERVAVFGVREFSDLIDGPEAKRLSTEAWRRLWDDVGGVPLLRRGDLRGALLLWIFRRMVVILSKAESLREDERQLEVQHAVLRHEKRYKRLRRLTEAFETADRAESARREPIPESVRLFVWQRDEGKCVRCSSNQLLEFDHVIPVSKGGANTERNIQLLCQPCNREKGGSIA